MRRNLQTGEPELVPRNQGEARLQATKGTFDPFFMRGLFNPSLTDPTSIEPYLMASLMTPAAPVSALGYPLLGAARLAESGVRAQQGLPWMGEAGTGALYLAGGPIATKVGQGAKLAYGAAKPVVQGVARRVGDAMKSAPFDPVRRKVLQGIGAGTAALATAGTGLFQGLGGPTATKAVTKAVTPMLDQFHALARVPRWTWIKGWPHPDPLHPLVRSGKLPISTSTLRLKNGQPVTEEMLKKAGFRAAMHGNKVVGTHPVSSDKIAADLLGLTIKEGRPLSSLMKQMDAPSQAFFRALGY
jgi:hypothetical protein